MTEVFLGEVIGKTAMTSGGYPLGTIESIVADTETGELRYLLVKLTSASKPGQKTDAKGRAVIAFNGLKQSGSNIIIS
jgi:sporulation protein YlmC with PRC-barrel domain